MYILLLLFFGNLCFSFVCKDFLHFVLFYSTCPFHIFMCSFFPIKKVFLCTFFTGLIGSVIGIFLLAMIYEGIKFFREYLFKKYFTSLEYSSVSVLGDDGKPVTEVHKVARYLCICNFPLKLTLLMNVI